MSEAPANKSRWLVVLLSLVPVWLAVSAGAAVWWSLRDDKQEEEERNQRFAMEMSVERIANDMRKLDEVIGPRNGKHPQALIRAAAMIDGTLGPSNTGYQIKRIPGPHEAPIIKASLEQSKNGDDSIWVVAAYDSDVSEVKPVRPEESSAVASLIAVAQAMAKDDLPTNIHFLLLPHGNDPFTAVAQQVKTLMSIMPEPAFVICINHMSHGTHLIFNIGENQELNQFPKGLDPSSTQGLDIEFESTTPHFDTATLLEEDLTVVEVYAHHGSSDGEIAQNVAVSSGKLVEWLRRAARLQAAE